MVLAQARWLGFVLALAACRPLEQLPPGWDSDAWQIGDTPTPTDAVPDTADGNAAADTPDAICGAAGCAPAKQQGCQFVCDPAGAAAWACLQSTCGTQLSLCTADSTCLALMNGVFACALGCETDSCRQACAQQAPLPLSLAGCGWAQCW